MPFDTIPIPAPDIDSRDGERLAAEAIARLNEACPELTNNNAGSLFVALAEEQAWLVEQALYAVNRLPPLAAVEFARLFGIELRLATPATATLTFTVAPPAGTPAVIPAGTRVTTADGAHVFETDEELALSSASPVGSVSATRTADGHVLLDAGALSRVAEPVAWATGVTNEQAVDSGTEQEEAESALARMRSYQRRAERIVSARDLQEAIEELTGGGLIMRVFEKTEDGHWGPGEFARRVGCTTVLLMTAAGNAVSAEVKAQIGALSEQFVGHVYVYLKDPVFRTFDIACDVRLTGLAVQSVTRSRIETALRRRYEVKESNIGAPILRSDIIEEIEKTAGVASIVAQSPSGAILASPPADVELEPYEMPKLVNITLNFM
jgi:uncharacterized phage protein gp47/JayE